MEKSQTISELAKALVKFQSEMKPVSFDANNPFFKSKYATLSALVQDATPILVKNGLAVSQLTEQEGSVTTILMHTSGEYLSSTLTLKAVKDDPQGRGSAITYARRYAYASILGIVSDEDDDGNSATGLKEVAKQTTPTNRVSTPTNGHSEKPVVIPQTTLMGTIEKVAIEKFGSLEKFLLWRVENALPEDLTKLTDFELAKVFTKVREYKVKVA